MRTHGVQIRVVEHDALWPAGCPAGVDQQRQRVIGVLRRVPSTAVASRRQFVGETTTRRRLSIRRGRVRRSAPWRRRPGPDSAPRAGQSVGLIGVTAAPRRHAANSDTTKLGGVGQHDRDDVAGRHPLPAGPRRRARRVQNFALFRSVSSSAMLGPDGSCWARRLGKAARFMRRPQDR